MNITKSLKIGAAIVAVLAVCFGTLGPAVAGPTALKLTASKVKKIAKKEIAKAAPALSVKHATTAATLEGKTIAQIKTVVASASSTVDVADIGAGTDVVSVGYTTVAASKVVFSAVAELEGDGSTDDVARCVLSNDNVGVSPGYETTFDDQGAAGTNPATISVLGNQAAVPAGDHVAKLRCSTDSGGPIALDEAGIQVVAVPN